MNSRPRVRAVRLVCAVYCHRRFFHLHISCLQAFRYKYGRVVIDDAKHTVKSETSAWDFRDLQPIERARTTLGRSWWANVSRFVWSLMTIHHTAQTHGPKSGGYCLGRQAVQTSPLLCDFEAERPNWREGGSASDKLSRDGRSAVRNHDGQGAAYVACRLIARLT